MFLSFLWRASPDGARSQRPASLSRRRHGLLVCSSVFLGVLTLAPKLAYYARISANGSREAVYEARVEELLTGAGWLRVGWLDLLKDGTERATRYTNASCAGEMLVAVLPLDGQETLIRNRMGGRGRIFFIYDGKVIERPPRFLWVRDRLHNLFDSIGLAFFLQSPLLAIAGPADCRLDATVPWRSIRN